MWMTKNMLKLNDSKTEVIVITPSYRANEISIEHVRIADSEVPTTKSARNIGVFFDEHLGMDKQITSVVKSCVLHLKNIARIRQYIDQPACETLVHALISSRLDYANSLLFGLPKYQLTRLQRIQNIAARVVKKIRKYDHITPALISLHWLPVEKRILFKLLLITFKAVHRIAPVYLSEIVTIYEPKRSLRKSNKSTLLVIPKYNTKTYGKRAFAIAGPTEWNRLPESLRSITEYDIFKRKLKTFLFESFYEC